MHRHLVLMPEDKPNLTRLSVEVRTPIRDEHHYSIASTTSLSYYDPIGTAPTSNPSSLETVIISTTKTITLTTIALVTSENTLRLQEPTEAPLLSSTSTNIELSPGQIAGIAVGALASVLLLVLLVYLILTRAKWVDLVDKWRLEIREKKHIKESTRRLKKTARKETIHPAKNPVRNTRRVRDVADAKQPEPKPPAATRAASILITPEQKRYELGETGAHPVLEEVRRKVAAKKAAMERDKLNNRRRLGRISV
ncbi:hypothetical protein F5X98DRAFT_387442 [Xylaria grammica]|nr:hypothetical protein F5X98DRAFT_387442 [Xylaria grammica]